MRNPSLNIKANNTQAKPCVKVVALHTDFRLYWPARLKALSETFEKRHISLSIIEIAGQGSPYSFAHNTSSNILNWHILFPDKKPEDLDGREIQKPLFRLLDSINPDVIISGAIAFQSGALAVNYGLLKKRKIIIFDDAKNEAVKRNLITNLIKKAIYSGVDSMFYPSPDWINTGKSWGFKKQQMYFGVDVVDNDFWSKNRKYTNPYGEYFVAVGRQVPKKNFYSIALAYINYTNAVGREYAKNLLMIGEGPENQRIGDLVKMHNLSQKLIMLPYKTQEELAGIYQNASALICNSDITETWGLVINEAMACKCAIFASKQCGASSSLVQEGYNGYLYDCNDISTLTKDMIDFHTRGINYQQSMGEKSYEIITHWGLDKFCNGALNAINYVTKQPKRYTPLINRIIISLWKGRYRPV